MDALTQKIIEHFPGKVVRKDLTTMMKKSANVPTYVLEYLLGQYCSTDDQAVIDAGVVKIKKVLSENYVKPDQSEYIKSKIRENGEYTIIDKISVILNEKIDKYIAYFTNLHIDPFEVSPDLVTHNEKLLLGGIWCIMKIAYQKPEEDEGEDLFGEKKKAKKKTKFDSPFNIVSLKPIQMPNLDLNSIIEARQFFTKDEWIDLLLRSAGYEPNELTQKEKMHYLLRLIPLVEKNYNLVELGPRGTGKSYIYSEISPYSILMAKGNTTVANMFYNMGRRRVGLVGNWDCIAFDEVGGMAGATMEFIQTMKTYMANGNFALGQDTINADASIAFEGNTFRTLADMIRTSHLFEPFPEDFNSDSAFFDRINAYLPGWETPKLREGLFTKGFGLITDCLSEFCHAMRKYDFTSDFMKYYEFNKAFNTRDDKAVTKTFSGLVKLIYPDENMTKEEVEELLIYAIECRRRVKEQLKKMSPSEFNAVGLGYIDRDTNEEKIVNVPEQPDEALVSDTFEPAGFVYAIGRSQRDLVAVYRLENTVIKGTGKFDSKNIEGLGSNKPVKDSLNAAYVEFGKHTKEIISKSPNDFDYTLFINDLQSKGLSDEVSVAEVVGLCSAVANVSVKPSMPIVGRVVVSGTMIPPTTSLNDILVAAVNAGAKKIMLPEDCEEKFDKISPEVKKDLKPVYYSTPIDAARKALGLED